MIDAHGERSAARPRAARRSWMYGAPLLALALQLLSGCGGNCDAAKDCQGKNDRIFLGDKIIPICGATTERDGTRYSWTTPTGTCSCTLDSRANGNFWRNCVFEVAK